MEIEKNKSEPHKLEKETDRDLLDNQTKQG
jgi:hypothetical protein